MPIREEKGAPLTWTAFIVLSATLLFTAPSLEGADTLPSQITDTEFSQMIMDYSEPGGSFNFEFMSNEIEFPSIIPSLKESLKMDGVYLGVGPEQNFTYIAALQPKIAFIFDIRRQNMVEHLLYKALFGLSSNRVDFISKLFARRVPRGLSEKFTARELLLAYSTATADPELFDRNLQAIKDYLIRDHHIPLPARDQADLNLVYRSFVREGPGGDYTGRIFGGFGRYAYADLMMATDERGQAQSYLATEQNFQLVREMERKNLVVPLVGDFAGATAIRAVAKYLKDHHATVTAFYTSNVEQYLFQQSDEWRRFYENLSFLPIDSSSTLIRSSHFAYGAGAQRARRFPRTTYVMLLCPLTDLMAAFKQRQIQTYDDAIRLSR